MSLKDQIMTNVKTAMKAKDQATLQTLRLLQSAIKNKEIEARPNELTEEDVQGVIKKAVKQRQEAIEQYKSAGREDLAAQEQSELEILEDYLPEQMSREQVEKIVSEVVQEQGASSMKDMGSVMKEVMNRTGGNADNKIVSETVKAQLQ